MWKYLIYFGVDIKSAVCKFECFWIWIGNQILLPAILLIFCISFLFLFLSFFFQSKNTLKCIISKIDNNMTASLYLKDYKYEHVHCLEMYVLKNIVFKLP